MLSSGVWLEAASLSDSSLSDMVPGLIDLQLDAKAPSTVLKCKTGGYFPVFVGDCLIGIRFSLLLTL